MPYITPRKQSSDRSHYQPTGKHCEDPVAAKRTAESDEDMDITECMPFSIVTSNMSTSEIGKEGNGTSVHNSDLCKKQPEDLEIHPTKVAILTHRKKPRKVYNCDASDESVLDEEWKPKKYRRKKSKSKARSANIKCKSLSRSIKTVSTTGAEVSSVKRYRHAYCRSGAFSLL